MSTDRKVYPVTFTMIEWFQLVEAAQKKDITVAQYIREKLFVK